MYVWNGSEWEAIAPTVPESPIAYQASAPVSPSTGDIWVDSDGDVGTFDRQLVRYRFVASGGETSLSGVDANGFTLAYVPGAEQVYLNGVLLVRTSDYTATDGTNITALSPALAVDDVVEVFAYNSFNIANTYTQAEIDGSLALKSDVSATGLVHINTTSFSAVASQSINDVFSSTYDNYLILFYSKGSTNLSTNFKMRAGGSDESGSVYDNARVYNITSTATAGDDQNQTGATIGTTGTLPNQFATINLMNPNVALETAINMEVSNWSASAQRAHRQGTLIQTTTQYTGFSIIPSTGNITGSISVYGYRK